jgi:hypothetical protein
MKRELGPGRWVRSALLAGCRWDWIATSGAQGVGSADEARRVDGEFLVDEFEPARSGDIAAAVKVGGSGFAVLEELLLFPELSRLGQGWTGCGECDREPEQSLLHNIDSTKSSQCLQAAWPFVVG